MDGYRLGRVDISITSKDDHFIYYICDVGDVSWLF